MNIPLLLIKISITHFHSVPYTKKRLNEIDGEIMDVIGRMKKCIGVANHVSIHIGMVDIMKIHRCGKMLGLGLAISRNRLYLLHDTNAMT